MRLIPFPQQAEFAGVKPGSVNALNRLVQVQANKLLNKSGLAAAAAKMQQKLPTDGFKSRSLNQRTKRSLNRVGAEQGMQAKLEQKVSGIRRRNRRKLGKRKVGGIRKYKTSAIDVSRGWKGSGMSKPGPRYTKTSLKQPDRSKLDRKDNFYGYQAGTLVNNVTGLKETADRMKNLPAAERKEQLRWLDNIGLSAQKTAERAREETRAAIANRKVPKRPSRQKAGKRRRRK